MTTHTAAYLLTLALLGAPAILADQQDSNAPFQAALAEVNANCPQEYPDQVTPIPEPHQLAALDIPSLINLLESWNPSLRAVAAKELGTRGDKDIPELRKGTRSENWTVRAGTTAALAAIANNLKPADPDEKLPEQLTLLANDFIELTKDPKLEVRIAALGGLSQLAPQTATAAMAVLNLCSDNDVYLAQDAMITLDKKFSIASLQQDEVIAAFKKTFDTPFPRGRGHILRQIARMDEKTQRKFIPQLLSHLDWKPARDTMFAKGGQEEALTILTDLKVKELIPRLPSLMGKTFHGPGLFTLCLESARTFGKDAKSIIPELRSILADIEKNGKDASIKPHRADADAINNLKQTIEHLESL